MPWTQTDYPHAFKDLPEEVRNKAIAIVNELLEDGMDDGIAINTALSRAKDWAAEKVSEKKEGPENWSLREAGSTTRKKTFSKTDAIRSAKRIAQDDERTVTLRRKNAKAGKQLSVAPPKKIKK